MAWTTTELLAAIRRSGSVPSSTQAPTSDTDLLALADDELQGHLVPLVLQVHEEYYVHTLSQSVTSGTAAYPVPRRAIASRLRDLFWVDSSGSRSHLARLAPETLVGMVASAAGAPSGFWLDAANINLYPTPSATGASLLERFQLRPSKLVATTNCRQLTAVTADTAYGGGASTGRTRLQWASGLATATLGSTIDIVSNQPPFESRLLGATYASAGGTVTSIDVASSSLLSTPVVGDWVVTEETSCVPQLPVELIQVLAQRTAARVLMVLGFGQESEQAKQRADDAERKALYVLQPRTDGNPKILTGGMMSALNRGSGWMGW